MSNYANVLQNMIEAIVELSCTRKDFIVDQILRKVDTYEYEEDLEDVTEKVYTRDLYRTA